MARAASPRPTTLELVQQGYRTWREVRWSDLSRGMAKDAADQLNTDEGHIRVFWRRWSELMEGAR
jgi:p-cumate 2,3-dioxygenase alpha subunit